MEKKNDGKEIFQTEINKAIMQINKDIEEQEYKKSIIKKLQDTDVLSETLWHELCETPIRYSPVLAIFVENLFPKATEIKVAGNAVYFVLEGFDVKIPTYAVHSIDVDTHWYCCSLNEDPKFELYGDDEKTRKYFELLDSGTAHWDELAKCCIRNGSSYRKWYLCFLWLTNRKKVIPDRQVWEKKLAEKKCEYQKKIAKRHQEREAQKQKVEFLFTTILPQLEKFSKKHFKYQSCDYSSLSLEKIAEIENINYF